MVSRSDRNIALETLLLGALRVDSESSGFIITLTSIDHGRSRLEGEAEQIGFLGWFLVVLTTDHRLLSCEDDLGWT